MNLEQLLIAKRTKAETNLKFWEKSKDNKVTFSTSFIDQQVAYCLGQIRTLNDVLTALETNEALDLLGEN